ncbi:uncharacterized protein LOC115627963 [Scaptodrosophila lebanonensis]|uniref:Uncharacterized protein LOC115627963 n=1 Tax=Drosophila lebanonensis TaxID=7225 RepID=A0A6J2TXT7_DROLE|nr:uncharacterized protein LOC115627963 [Scaptodrosophila lebanonensis]
MSSQLNLKDRKTNFPRINLVRETHSIMTLRKRLMPHINTSLAQIKQMSSNEKLKIGPLRRTLYAKYNPTTSKILDINAPPSASDHQDEGMGMMLARILKDDSGVGGEAVPQAASKPVKTEEVEEDKVLCEEDIRTATDHWQFFGQQVQFEQEMLLQQQQQQQEQVFVRQDDGSYAPCASQEEPKALSGHYMREISLEDGPLVLLCSGDGVVNYNANDRISLDISDAPMYVVHRDDSVVAGMQLTADGNDGGDGEEIRKDVELGEIVQVEGIIQEGQPPYLVQAVDDGELAFDDLIEYAPEE